MNTKRFLEIGGLIAGGLMVLFGVAALYMGFDARSTVRDSIKQEQIFFGSATEDEAVAKYAEQWSEQQVLTGEQSRAFAQIMREHTLARTGGLTYAQMGRFQSAAKPDDPAGTSDEAAAAKDAAGQPIPNGARNTWVTETALATALNVSFMAENLALFALVVGFALLLAGIGLVILALSVFGRAPAEAKVGTPSRMAAPAAG